MHFCQDELYAVLSFIPQLQHLIVWCRFKLVTWRVR